MHKELTEKELKKWKEAFAKKGIVHKTDDEYREAVHNLVGYFDILVRMDLQQKSTEENEQEPLL